MSIFDDRQQVLKKRMDEEGMDALVICADIYRPGNTAYFTGLHQCGAGTSQAWSALLLTSELSVLFVGFEMVNEAQALINSNTKICRSDEIEAFLKKLSIKNAGAIGLNVMSAAVSASMLSALNLSGWKDAAYLMNEQRRIKSDGEIEEMKAAFRASDKGFAAGMAAIKAGATEKDIADECAIAIIKAGAKPGFWPMVHAGKNTGNAMQTASLNKICEDNIVMVDIGAYKDGYFSDNTRAALYKVTTARMIKVVETCQQAMKAGFAAAVPGKPICDVENAVRNVISENGFGEYIVHNVGHGIAWDAEEDMPIGPDSGLIMRPGMTFTIEPGIYIRGECGCRLEEAVYMTGTGALPFSAFPLENIID